jgi:predicted phosphoribosyltransferase
MGMHEDPVARRNRGTSTGLWVLGGLALLVAALLAVALLRPIPVPAEPEPAAAAVSMEQRVANDTIEANRREQARRHPAS